MTIQIESLLSESHKVLLSNSQFTSRDDVVSGRYVYFHYCCDKVDDRGWGYRTLQSICSWAHYSKKILATTCNLPVPNIFDIQSALVAMQDKPERFLNSKDWIGSFEVCLCLDYFYDIPSKILHIPPGKLFEKLQIISGHFTRFHSPIMMGGDSDASSKGIYGIHMGTTSNDSYLLVIDPHCANNYLNNEQLVEQGWVKWQQISDFNELSFYNLCMPQHKV